MSVDFELPICARRSWQGIDSKEIALYGMLFVFLISRVIRIGNRNPLRRGLTAILEPLVATVIFACASCRLAHVQSDSPPYQLFAYAGLAGWTFFSTSRTRSGNRIPYSLEDNPVGDRRKGRPHFEHLNLSGPFQAGVGFHHILRPGRFTGHGYQLVSALQDRAGA